MRSLIAVSGVLLACLGQAVPAAANEHYGLAGGCVTLRAESNGALLAKSSGDYRAGEGRAERFRLQATELGKYLLYGSRRDFLAVDGQGRVGPTAHPTERAVWEAHLHDGALVFYSPSTGKALAAGPGGELGLADVATAGGSERFGFRQSSGCADYPEAEVNAVGKPFTGTPRYGEVRGYVDPHVHLMTFEFLGGEALWGRTWHPFGAAHASW
jgi:hypothetical protein